ncbi:LysR family transcriptional regulator [Roseovarius sp. SYSU LYC5161]|uniref:LysR family transcriptional regulator n=1 Tax=Roseovarius halophilus (ex Wu et al. 2025) TaxID=3376060 RepID=UPI0028710E8C|nr:LysR family transcriptional regulator [Roseovarius sp.]
MLPRLGLHHLVVLLAVSETGGATPAAARLGLTQSAVTHRLREAERRLGTRLARRVEGRVTLTPEGDRLVAFADPMLRELAQLEDEIEARQRAGHRIVRLGQATYSRFHWLPVFLDRLARDAPDLVIELSGGATRRPLAALREGMVDVSTVYGRPASADRFHWTRLAADPLVAVMAPTHPCAAAPVFDSAAFGDERLFTYPLTVEPGFEWETLLGKPNAAFRRVTALETPEATIDLIRAGYGVALFSSWAIAPELADGTLVARPIGHEGMSLEWWAVTRADDGEESAAARVAQSLAAWGERRDAPLAALGFDGPPDG